MKNSYLSDIISALTEIDPMFYLYGYHDKVLENSWEQGS